jgi:peroxiredoxin Q/BCP
VILGASFDRVDANAKFAAKFDFPFKLLSDTTRELGMKYGAAASATDGAAKRISYLIAPTGKIAQVWGKVDVTAHATDVIQHIV